MTTRSHNRPECPRSRRERSTEPVITEQQREALHLHALSLLAQISQVRGALTKGDSAEADRIGEQFDEDRRLLKVLTLAPVDREAALTNPSADLRRSLIRVRESAAAELRLDGPGNSQAPLTPLTKGRARLIIAACDSLLEAAA